MSPPKVVVDFRSDTVTRPSAAMRRVIAEAEVGDNVFGDCPTVERLEAMAAEITGKEAALYVPSGESDNPQEEYTQDDCRVRLSSKNLKSHLFTRNLCFIFKFNFFFEKAPWATLYRYCPIVGVVGLRC